jgi:hypothetical protein
MVTPPRVMALVYAAAERHAVPTEILTATCFMESRLSLAPRYASLCGVRIHHAYVRDDAQSADIGARSLARWRASCGSWSRALVGFRHGRGCGVADSTGYARNVLTLARRLGGP